MKTSHHLKISTAICLLALPLACAGAYEEEESEQLGSLAAPIQGGTLVTSIENTQQPFSPAVRIGFVGTGSGVKIGPNRFLTAAHVMSGDPANVKITNARDGDLQAAGTRFTLTKVVLHPSSQLVGEHDEDLVDLGGYDVAVFDIAENTSSIPIATVTEPHEAVLPGATGLTLVSYGRTASPTSNCDTQGPGAGQKQKGLFDIGQADGNDLGGHVRYIQESSALLNTCKGDSGGPLSRLSGNQGQGYAVRGVVAGGAKFTRLSNVVDWIKDPVVNKFNANSTGYLMNAKPSNFVRLGITFKTLNCAAEFPNSDVKLHFCDGKEGFFNGLGTRPGWQLTTANSITPGHFNIINRFTGKCLRLSQSLPNNDVNVVAGSCVPKTAPAPSPDKMAQEWQFIDLGAAVDVDGNPLPALIGSPVIHYFRVRNQMGKCLGAVQGSSALETDLKVFTCSSAADQKWVFTR